MSKIKKIFIYSDYPSRSLSVDEIGDYLRSYGFTVQNREDLFEFSDFAEEEFASLAAKTSATTVSNTSVPLDEIYEPGYGEIVSELEKVKGKKSYTHVGAVHELPLFYDGLWLQRIFYGVMSRRAADELESGFVHIIFTGRLFGTFETKRYHARVILTGLPSLISTSGIVEAPARPREYYWLKAGLVQGGKDLEELDLFYKGKFIEYDDPGITQVLKSYALQAVFYEITGNPFCDNSSCCLYNSHRQEEVLKAQLRAELCIGHKHIIKNLR